MEQKKLKTLVCQLGSKFDNVLQNQVRALVSLEEYSQEDQFDVIMFPEMAFTNYYYENRQSIESVLEKAGDGPIYSLCKKIALKLNAYVICGYAEKTDQLDQNSQIICYNSCYVLNRQGQIIMNYRKKHLYELDKLWGCSEGDDFKTVEIYNLQGKCFKSVIAICMDINPWEFKDNSQFELAEFCKKTQLDALFFVSAWSDEQRDRDDAKSIESFIDYLLYRVYPLVNGKYDKENSKDQFKQWLFFCADRVGKEGQNDKFCYRGCSFVCMINPIKLYHVLDKRNEGFIAANATMKDYSQNI